MPGRCRLSPEHYRRQPGLCRGFTGINRSQSGLTGTLPVCGPASTGAASGNRVIALNKIYKSSRSSPVDRR
ncbi:hypothetical protein DPMN_149863 [Dreissena polymorpha]|uniref:Uncharacterized protein n=1 Tax=Dreissena polymorpha TaxID=45954 RepID=A0A9D4J541_DREPO|nr:hypothetical protein DPMN_149863 [Dreissena polymorpha]